VRGLWLVLGGLAALPQGAPAPAVPPAAAAPAGGARDAAAPTPPIDVPARMHTIEERWLAGDSAKALSLTDELVERSGALELSERTRAQLHYARGLFTAKSKDGPARLAAVDDFQSARALAGPGGLRLDATYDAGGVQLLEAERLHDSIPEIAQEKQGAGGAGAPAALAAPGGPGAPGAGAPAAPPAAGAAPGAGGPAEDPLPAARAAYLAARTTLVERLRAGWQDADPRADLELIQRRLHELERIERQREQQKQQQEKNQQQKSPDQKKDQQKKDQQEQDQKGDQKDQKDQQKDGKDQKPQDQKDAKDTKDQEPKDAEPKEQDTKTAPTKAPDDPQEAKAKPADPGGEKHLTKEEVSQLLDQLKDIDQKAALLRAALREARRVKVERDW